MAQPGDRDPAAPTPADEVETAKIESRVALAEAINADPDRAADIILSCRELVLEFDKRLHEMQERLANAEMLAVRAIRKANAVAGDDKN